MTNKKVPKALYGAPDRPLKIGDVEIPCYVLEDEKRVLVHRAMVKSLGMARGGSSKGGGDRLAHFVGGSRIKPYIDNELRAVIKNPLKFRTTKRNLAYGYEAEVLAKICFAVIKAEKEGKLQKQQEHIADQCRILIEGFAIVGINALVDEVTGYQEVRDRVALQKILEKYIRDEVQKKWAKTFPDKFFENMFRLKGWQYRPLSVKRPGVVGHYINDIIYSRLVPGVLNKLNELNPKTPRGYRKHRHFQWLTDDYGVPELREHLSNVIFLMETHTKWDKFRWALNRAAPKYGDTMPLPLKATKEESE